ncbi:hypothetical protein BKA69DRAFT_1096730 [Paraphysoderma sedebokerense]|nr:hypothetical protein BKA69DRAFT_1096730 [Paraphysoderma sedebokerense]
MTNTEIDKKDLTKKIRKIIKTGDPDKLTFRIIRENLEKQLNYENGFLKQHKEWLKQKIDDIWTEISGASDQTQDEPPTDQPESAVESVTSKTNITGSKNRTKQKLQSTKNSEKQESLGKRKSKDSDASEDEPEIGQPKPTEPQLQKRSEDSEDDFVPQKPKKKLKRVIDEYDSSDDFLNEENEPEVASAGKDRNAGESSNANKNENDQKRVKDMKAHTKDKNEPVKKSSRTEGKDRPEIKLKISDKDEEKIKNLKKYINACGVRKIWSKELAGLTSGKQIIEKLSSILRELGIDGRPSLEKAKKIREKRELEAEVQSVDLNNVIASKRRRGGSGSTNDVPKSITMDLSKYGDPDDDDVE